MANHPRLGDWQHEIQLLKALNATEQAPADVKKDVGDKLKQLENVVNKFNACFDDIDKRQDILEDVRDEAALALHALKAQFDEAQGDFATKIKTAIEDVDDCIANKERNPGKKRGDVQAPDLPQVIDEVDPGKLTNQIQAEQKRDEIKNTLAVVERKLREVETFCAEVTKWESELVKARKAATDTSPVDSPIDAWTNIGQLENAIDKLNGLLAEDDEQRTALKENADTIAKLIGKDGILKKLFSNYRTVAVHVEIIKQEVSDAYAEWKWFQASRQEKILVKIYAATDPASGSSLSEENILENTEEPPYASSEPIAGSSLPNKQVPPAETVTGTTHQEGG